MNARFLPGLVFVTCVLIGFGVGFEADGQDADESQWTTPDWSLPWGMTWPDPAVMPVSDTGQAGQQGDTSDSLDDTASALSDEVGPEPAAAESAIFPGLVNPPAPAAASPEGVGAPASATGESTSPETLTAQLTQLEEVEAQLRKMSAANQAAKSAVTAALAGKARPEPGEPATPAQVAESLILLTDMVKKMKPKTAAELLQQWDDSLAIGILRRLGSRRATPIVSKMPLEVSGRLTSLIAAGVGALPPAIAEGAEAPPQGE